MDLPYKRPPVYTTTYEYAKLVGIRALQLSMGAKPLVKFEKFDPIRIAQAEINARALPYYIIRKLPDGTEEQHNIQDMIIRDT